MCEILGNLVNPKIFVIGVFHGDEPQGDYLIREYFKIRPDSSLLFIPCLNRSGFLANTRVNSNGVDLNRNFPTNNWMKSEKNEFFGGNFPGSETETKFLIKLIEKYEPKIILTLHAPYKIVNYDGEALELAQKISEIMDYPVEGNIGYPTPGSFGTWAGVERNIKVITLELDEEIEVVKLKEPVFKVFELLEGMK